MRSDLNRGTEDLLNRSLNDASETLLDLIQLDPTELVPFSGLMSDGCVYFPVNGGTVKLTDLVPNQRLGSP